jgi:hypothetical protein
MGRQEVRDQRCCQQPDGAGPLLYQQQYNIPVVLLRHVMAMAMYVLQGYSSRLLFRICIRTESDSIDGLMLTL